MFFSSVILFIVEDVTYNICDQKFHEFEIRKQNPSVYVIRKTLTQVADEGKLTSDKRLIVDGKEVRNSLLSVYFNIFSFDLSFSFDIINNIIIIPFSLRWQ